MMMLLKMKMQVQTAKMLKLMTTIKVKVKPSQIGRRTGERQNKIRSHVHYSLSHDRGEAQKRLFYDAVSNFRGNRT